MPAALIPAQGAVEQQAEGVVLGEVRRLADCPVSRIECVGGNTGIEPAEQRVDPSGRVRGREILRRERPDDDGPDKYRNPLANPARHSLVYPLKMAIIRRGSSVLRA